MSMARNTQSRRIRNLSLGLASVALAFYFGIITLLIYRSHH
jgi:hypothetical protein